MKGASARKAFAKSVEQFLQQRRNRPHSHVIGALAVDQRADSIWNKFGGDETATEAFLTATRRALLDCAFGDAIEGARRKISKQNEDMLFAIDAVLRCSRTYSERLKLPRRLEEQLRSYAASVRESGGLIRQADADRIPRLRKSNDRVHFARIFVAQMLAHLNQPYFRQVADAINVMYDLDPEITEAGVRSASRKLVETWSRAGGQFETKIPAE